MTTHPGLYTKDCIRTNSGLYVNLRNPQPETLIIEDIAHALSREPRFGGHTDVVFSVAEHCINSSIDSSYRNKFTALMHDAVEAYLKDIQSPIKNLLPQYKIFEDRFQKVLSKKFCFDYPFPEEVIEIDKKMLEYEWDLWLGNKNQLSLNPNIVKKRFLELYNELKPF